MNRLSIPVEAKNFPVSHSVQTAFGAQRGSCLIGTCGSFSGLKRRGLEVDCSPPTFGVKVNNAWR